MSKALVQKFFCYSCESDYRITFKEDEVSHNPVFCPFCSTEIDFDKQDDGNDREDE